MWPWEQPARQLPIPVRPVPNETVLSFLARLANANRLDHDVLLRHVARCQPPASGSRHDAMLNPAAVRRLLAVSGQPLRSLHRALPALSHVGGVDTADMATPTLQWRVRLDRHDLLPACTHCMARRGITDRAVVHLPAHHYLCVQHARWLRDGQPEGGQVDLASIPVVVHAQRRHDRLVKRHALDVIDKAFADARGIVQQWFAEAWHLVLKARWKQRLKKLGATSWSPYGYGGPSWIVIYPEAVTLAGLFVSPLAVALITALDDAPVERFYGEVARQLALPDPKSTRYGDPLARWVVRQRFRWRLLRKFSIPVNDSAPSRISEVEKAQVNHHALSHLP